MLGDPEDTLRPTLSFPMRHPDDVASGTVSSVATVQSSVRALVLGSYLNALLVFLPFGYIAKAAGWVGIRDDVEVSFKRCPSTMGIHAVACH